MVLDSLNPGDMFMFKIIKEIKHNLLCITCAFEITLLYIKEKFVRLFQNEIELQLISNKCPVFLH